MKKWKGGITVLTWALSGGAVFLLCTFVAVYLLNSEYFTRNAEIIELAPGREFRADTVLLNLRLRLLRFDEETGRLNAELLAYTRDADYARSLQQGSARVYVTVLDGMSNNSYGALVRTRLTFPPDSFPYGSESVQSNTVELRPVFASEISTFPFDTYRARLLITVHTQEGILQPFSMEVERSYFSRSLKASGSAGEATFRAERPLLDRIVVVVSVGIFLIVCSLVLASLMLDQNELSGVEEVVAWTGFILSAAGFREFAGLNALSVRPVLDIAVFLVPLVLITSFFAYRLGKNIITRRRQDLSAVPPSGHTDA